MPSYECILAFDFEYADKLEDKVTYFRATEEIKCDFNAKMWTTIINLVKPR